jgi:TonB family protein
MNRDATRRILRRGLRSIKEHCHPQGCPSNGTNRGQVTIQLTIGTMGRVKGCKVQQTDLGSRGLEACMVKAMRRLRFPPPEGGSAVVSAPVRFSQGSGSRR